MPAAARPRARASASLTQSCLAADAYKTPGHSSAACGSRGPALEAAPRPREGNLGLPNSKRPYASWGPPSHPVESFPHVATRCIHPDDAHRCISLESKGDCN